MLLENHPRKSPRFRSSLRLINDEPSLENLIDYLLTLVTGHLPRFNREIYRAQLKLLLLNFKQSMNSFDGTLAISFRSAGYSPARYNRASYRVLIEKIVRPLIELGFVEIRHKGFLNHETMYSSMTRIAACDVVEDILSELSIPSSEFVEDLKECILLKDVEKRLIGYPDTELVTESRRSLEEYNAFIQTQSVDLFLPNEIVRDMNEELAQSTDDNRIPFDPTRKTLFRSFNNSSFESGGRYYGGWWQNIPSRFREMITIQNSAVIECDYSTLHPSILYAEVGAQPPEGDAYSLDVIEPTRSNRKIVKKAFNTALNCSTRQKTLNAYRRHSLCFENINTHELLQLIEQKHQPILEYFHTGYGLYLQFIDSCMAEAIIMDAMRERNELILPVHDSFIVDHSRMDWLAEKMIEVFFHKYGVEPAYKFAGTGKAFAIEEDHLTYQSYSDYYERMDQWQLSMFSTPDPRGPQSPTSNEFPHEIFVHDDEILIHND